MIRATITDLEIAMEIAEAMSEGLQPFDITWLSTGDIEVSEEVFGVLSAGDCVVASKIGDEAHHYWLSSLEGDLARGLDLLFEGDADNVFLTMYLGCSNILDTL